MTEARFLPVPIDQSNVVGWAETMVRSKRFMVECGHIVRFVLHGEPVQFCITNPDDLIQKHHAIGVFYEAKELQTIQRYFPFGGTYVDIGANIGNHALYVAKFLRAGKIIPFEPNPKAIELLVANFILNNAAGIVDFSHLGNGVGDPTTGMGFDTPEQNLGATKLVQGAGDVTVISGDDALKNTHVHFFKIDVEGMEIEVLASLENTIQRCRPNLMVEVDTHNRGAFADWMRAHNYGIAHRFKRFRDNQNFLVVPNPDQPAHAEKR